MDDLDVVPLLDEDVEELLSQWEQEATTPRQIAVLRIRCNGGLAARFLPLLRRTWTLYSSGCLDADEEDAARGAPAGQPLQQQQQQEQLCLLHRVVKLHRHWAQQDAVLAEELALQGTHAVLTQILEHCSSSTEDDDDDEERSLSATETLLLEMEEMVYDIAASSRCFPVKTTAMSLTHEELRSRLPLVFQVRSDNVDSSLSNTNMTITTFIHQVTTRQSAQSDVGFIMWPSAVILSRWLVRMVTSSSSLLWNQKDDRPATVLEIGAGCGLTALVVAQLQRQLQQQHSLSHHPSSLKNETTASADYSSSEEAVRPAACSSPSVLITDFNPIVLENLKRNVILNDVSKECEVAGLDFYAQSGTSTNGWIDANGNTRAPVELLLGSDIICQASDAVAAAKTVHDALKPSGVAFIVCADSTHRFGVDRFPTECQRVDGLDVETRNVRDVEGLQDLQQTAGYVENMNLTMFTIRKAPQ